MTSTKSSRELIVESKPELTAQFNPETAIVGIPFSGDFNFRTSTPRRLRFGPTLGPQRFHVTGVFDAATGAKYPKAFWQVEDVGENGKDHRLVAVQFLGERFMDELRKETEPSAFLSRLKEGLRQVRQETDACLESADLAKIVNIYDQAINVLRGTHEPLLAALATRKVLAIQVCFHGVDEKDPKPGLVTLHIQPEPRFEEG